MAPRLATILGVILILGGVPVSNAAGPEGAPAPAPEVGATAVAIEGAAALAPWFEALASAMKGSGLVRVLHLGDSHIARDGFSGDLRDMLAARFGAGARGMLPPGPVYPFFQARGVELDMGPGPDPMSQTGPVSEPDGAGAPGSGWRVVAAADPHAPGPFGLASARLEAPAGSRPWIALSGLTAPVDRLAIGHWRRPGGGSLLVEVDGAATRVSTAGAAGPGFATIPLAGLPGLVRIHAMGDGPVVLTSLVLEGQDQGAQVHAFGWPGATAQMMARWDDALLRAELGRLAPHLIILSYGTNEGFDDGLDVAAHAAAFAAQLRRLRALARGAGLLVTGGSDAARLPAHADPDARPPAQWVCAPLSDAERAGYAQLVETGAGRLLRWHAPPGYARVQAALRMAALNNGAAFWNWRAAMGGPCAIHRWRLAEPPLARPDHVHLTAAGQAASAAALMTALDGAFVAWQGDHARARVP